MRRTTKRVVAALLLGLSLALGAVGAGQLAQQQPVIIANPGGGTGTGGGG